MLKKLWSGLILLALLYAGLQGRLQEVLMAIPSALMHSIPFILILALFMAIWLGLLRLAESIGVMHWIARCLTKPMRWLFPTVPSDHPANYAIVMNLSANMMGLSNAATPLGLKAMGYLAELNQHSKTASHAMCTLLALNTSSIQLIPATTVAFLVAGGAQHSTRVIGTALIATICSTLAAVIAVKLMQQRYRVSREVEVL